MASIARWAWRHKRTIAVSSVVAVGGYYAYRLYQKKRELDDLIDSLGLGQLLSGDGGRPSREERVREHFAATQREAVLRSSIEACIRLADDDGATTGS